MEGDDHTSGIDPYIMMEEILDSLKLLDYENKLIKQKGFKPLSRVYFAQAHSNPSDQFMYFISLVTWMLAINNHQVQGWNKYDDPMTASQNVILELQKLNIDVNMPPNKLKTGFGEGVCTVLLQLAQLSLQNKFRFKKPVIRQDKDAMDDDGDEMGDEMEGNADLADQVNQEQSDDDDIKDDFNDFGQGAIAKEMEQDMAQMQIIQSSISREEWQLEVERVANKLRMGKVGTDGKEWRSHLDQTKKYADSVKAALPDVRYKLERLSDDVTKALEKISKKESLLSRSFQGMTGDYRHHTDNLRDIQNNFQSVSKSVAELENELTEVNDRLTNVQGKIDNTGKSFSDNSPLQNIKKSIATVKNDIKNIDIRIGVVANTLLQLKLKDRTKTVEDGKTLDILENEYEIEM